MKPLLVLILPLVIAATSVHAAPASSEELTSTNESRSLGAVGGGSNASSTAAPVVLPGTQSKTVELLLQLQDQPNALGKDSPGSVDPARRGTASPSSTSAPPKPGAAVPEDNPLQALKSAILRDAAPRQTASETGTPSTSGATETDRRTPAGGSSDHSSSASSEPKESLLAHPVVRFIRENRTLIVLVSLAALAAVWLTANFSMRGSR